MSQVYSRSMPALRRVIWQYPPQQFEMVQEWVDAHPEGTPIAVHPLRVNGGGAGPKHCVLIRVFQQPARFTVQFVPFLPIRR